MARGWESKAVADQIEEVNSRKEQARAVQSSAEERVRKERLDSLLLSRSRLLEQLERATHPSHRNMLLNGLNAIETQIDDLK
ncbi:MAG TPA: hypothetical protein VKA78_08395 [Pyrinomonadaceae bacterium]|nr:hypothetical protein [Pyrinomonadaceae bacterium]